MLGAPAVLTAAEALTGRVISAITLEGLRKTREEVVYNLIDARPGDVVTADLVDDIEASLVDSDLFAEVTVTGRPVGEDTAEIVVDIDEKWTLVPIPFFSTDGSGFNGGLILIESNLFGRNKQLVSAAFGGTGGARGFFAYADPAVFESRWTTSLSAATGRSEEDRELPDGTAVRTYETESRAARAGLGYRFTRSLEASAGIRVRDERITSQSIGAAAGDATEIDDPGTFLEPDVSVSYDGTRAVDVLRVGPRLSLDGRTVTGGGWEVQATAGWSAAVFGTHRLRLLASGGFGEMPEIAETVISGRDGYRTLPYQAVSADSWGSGTVIYDLPVLSDDWGALVLSHYWEAGAYDTAIIDPQPFFGPGGGFRVYIRQVAIPALGLDVAYNLRDGGFVFSFSLGAQM